MKNYILILLSCILLIACASNDADQPAAGNDTAMSIYSWQASLNDTSGNLIMKKVETAGPDSLSPEAVVKFLNTTNENIILELTKLSGDTIYLKIADAMYLTQQMGSSGPTIYIARAVYNLTEIPGIKFVTLDFEEGDHATPGTYNRDSFNDK